MKPRVGVSACLLGREVRHDGRHKRNAFLCDELADQVEWVAVCPEVEVGMPVPRPRLSLVGDRARPRLIARDGADHTAAMEAWAAARVAELADLDGYVLKSRSPSCGLASAELLDQRGAAIARDATGVWAAALRAALPDLPVVEESWLDESARRREFLERVTDRCRSRGRPS